MSTQAASQNSVLRKTETGILLRIHIFLWEGKKNLISALYIRTSSAATSF